MMKRCLLSNRIQATDAPCIVAMQRLMRESRFKGDGGVMSLAQGVVFWPPPPAALQEAAAALHSPAINSYGPDEGIPELRQALKAKLAKENGLHNAEVMVTSGANQAFVNVVLSLCDSGDQVVLFAPFYFNHAMAAQMTSCTLVHAPCTPDLLPDADWLEANIANQKLVVLCNPGNPTGKVLPPALVQRISALCQRNGVWLVVDNTYETFVYGNTPHSCAQGDHVVNLFSFSKGFGMMGWRVGYLAYDASAGHLHQQLLKAQDTIPICPATISQRVALGALEGGVEWARERAQALSHHRELATQALSVLGPGALLGPPDGAIYMMARLPAGCTDTAVMEWLVHEHGVCVIPGSACGLPGHIRVSFANLPLERYRVAAARLEAGLRQLVANPSVAS